MKNKKLLAESEPLETSAIKGKRRFVPSKMKSTGAGMSLIGGDTSGYGKNFEQKKASVQDSSKPSTQRMSPKGAKQPQPDDVDT